MVFGAAARDLLVERVFHRLALARQTSGGNAHIYALRELGLRLAFGFGDLVEFLRRHACAHFFRCSRIAAVPTLPATSWS